MNIFCVPLVTFSNHLDILIAAHGTKENAFVQTIVQERGFEAEGKTARRLIKALNLYLPTTPNNKSRGSIFELREQLRHSKGTKTSLQQLNDFMYERSLTRTSY